MFPHVLSLKLPRFVVLSGLLQVSGVLWAQTVHVTVDVDKGRLPVSSALYGKNNCLSDNPADPLSAAEWQFLRDAGVRLVREYGGNNGTKYNWKLKLSSHPDWYNNVYAHDWDYAVASLQANLPGVQGMWGFQLLGKAAGNKNNNFNDWAYNRSQWWSGTTQNLAGGGVINAAGGGTATVNGNPALYLNDWSAEESTGLLDHWFGSGGVGVDRRGLTYWTMDNEPEIWKGTHDDVMPVQLSAEDFMQRYFVQAKMARAKFPEVRLLGPVAANEWQWYNWATKITVDGKTYPWLEYFIKRVGEEQARTGIRLLDVLDLHYYPGVTDPATIVQLHRIFFDRNFVNPEANGVRHVEGGWDNSINKEYIFGRCQDWLVKYLGKDHGVGLGLSEVGLELDQAPVTAVWYASTLGEFMKQGVEVFTPWSWRKGMWEVLHLFSRYNYTTYVQSVSDDETLVSAYTTRDDATGNLVVVLVNRALDTSKQVQVSLVGASLPDGSYGTLTLSGLPATETFVSHTQNALKSGSVSLASGAFNLSLPALSITSVQLRAKTDVVVLPPDPAATRLSNLSVRALGKTGDEVFTLGFVVSGGSPKSLLVRGIGPSLAPFGITHPMADPVTTLFAQDKTPVAGNDNWGASSNAAEISQVADKLGAFTLDPGSLDSALLVNLSSAPYTCQVAGKQGSQGVVLGELYEADSTGGSRLSNVSARCWLGGPDGQLIAGFVVSGPGSKQVLVRAAGPALEGFGVQGALKDPVLRVFRQGQDFPLYQNDNWGDLSYAGEVSGSGDAVGAFKFPSGSKDAALLLTLPPGVYSAMVSGAGDTSGVALVEVYEVK